MVPEHKMTGEQQQLIDDAAAIGVALNEDQSARALRLLDELAVWNRTYSLTAITEREAMIRTHLLDSFSGYPELHGTRIADVGTGAGFPGLPLALAAPQCQFTLIDSVAKKLRFVTHAARTLQLANVTAQQARVESLAPDMPYDTVMARAFATLADLVAGVQGICGPDTRVLAFKGRYPDDELAELPRGWKLDHVRAVRIPHLNAERNILTLIRQAY
jgi:16S rRNA (guanine527-N7)-methyltransferase